MKKNKIITSVLAIVAIALGVLCSFSGGKFKQDERVNLIFSGACSAAAKEGAIKFAELVEEYSDGTVTVDIFHDNLLGDDKTTAEGVQIGDIDIAVTSTSSLSMLYKDYYLFDTPYLFLDSSEVYDVGFGGEAGRKILKGMEDVGLKGLAFWENGFRNYTNNDIPVSSPQQTKGQKIRTMENEIHLKAWSAIGTNPTPMAFSELFTALQQGTVDGEENPIGIIYSNRFYEVQKYISLTQHVYTPYCVVMNPQRYDSLTEKQKHAVDRAMEEASKYQLEKSAEEEEAALEKMKKFGCEIIPLTTKDKEAFQSIVVENDIFEFSKSKMAHPQYFDEMLKELEEYRGTGR